MKWSHCFVLSCDAYLYYFCVCFRAIHQSSIFAIHLLHSLRVSSDKSRNRFCCPRWNSQLELCHPLMVPHGSKTPYPILLESIKENPDSQKRKIEKRNSRVNELYYGDMNALEEDELLLRPISNQSSEVKVGRFG